MMGKANQPTGIASLLKSGIGRDFSLPAEIESARLQLPEALRAQVVLRIKDDQLIFYAENNAVAQMLRYHAPTIARYARYDRWRILVTPWIKAPPAPAYQPPIQDKPLFSRESARMIRDAAALFDDDRLRQALLDIAATTEKQHDEQSV